MKPINEHRSTNAFCISSVVVKDLAALHAHFGATLNTVARERNDNISVYTVRVADITRIVDYRVNVSAGQVTILESRVIWTGNERLHTWNTGRLYTKEGQRIVAEVEEGSVTFVDVDRYVDGVVACREAARLTREEVRDVVMRAYDADAYAPLRDYAKRETLTAYGRAYAPKLGKEVTP